MASDVDQMKTRHTEEYPIQPNNVILQNLS